MTGLKYFWIRFRVRLRKLYVPIKIQLAALVVLVFVIPFAAMSYFIINHSRENMKDRLLKEFYARAEMLSLEMKDRVKDKIDLQTNRENLISQGFVHTMAEIPLQPTERRLIEVSFENTAGAALYFFNNEKIKNRIIFYCEKKSDGFKYYFFSGEFMKELLDKSETINPDDRVFLFNANGDAFLSNSLESEYEIDPAWQAAIHQNFWDKNVNTITEIFLHGQKYLMTRYQFRNLPLVLYLALPSEIAYQGLNEILRSQLIAIVAIGAIALLVLLWLSNQQIRMLKVIRSTLNKDSKSKLSVHVSTLRDERTEIFSEIIRVRKNEIRAQVEREIAEAKTQAKTYFLANMSHEIRNPLSAILGITNLLLKNPERENVQKNLQIIQRSGNNLLQILNDILDTSKIESGKLELDPQALNLEVLLTDLHDFYAINVREKSNELILKVSIKNPMVVGDGLRIRQVLVNLISNANKFTKQGRLHIHARRYGDSEKVFFFVHDTGIGITKAQSEKLFKPYEQAEASTARKYGGTGLGLTIALSISQLMGGKLCLRSKVGSGTTFLFTARLPMQTESATKNTPELAENDLILETIRSKKLKILVAEDDEINQMILENHLKIFSDQVDFVNNGKDAVAHRFKNTYALIFMDNQMPEMNGLEATRKIRAEEKISKLPPLPIIILSANAFQDDAEIAMQAGCNAYLAKPVNQQDLLMVIQKFL